MLRPGIEFYRIASRILLMLFMLTLCRLIFWAINAEYFSDPGVLLVLQGVRFDLIAVIFGLFPYLALTNIPYDLERKSSIRKSLKIYYLVVLGVFLLVNCIDMIYFRFTFKRSTWDIFSFVSTGDDTLALIPQFLIDYWYVVLLFIGLMTSGVFLYNKIENRNFKTSESVLVRTGFCLLMYLLLFVGSRGGIQLKPLNIMAASRYVQVQNIPLLLSTPFTMIKTVFKGQIEPKSYFESDDELHKHFSPIIHIPGDSGAESKNVVVLIMESLAKEYIGFYNDGKGFTPFLDSLMEHSLVFDNAYANGKRSIEALPAIFSALPNLMTEAYITSPYSGNKITSLAQKLKEKDYYSAFFHGGKNGTMGFDSYVNHTGFDEYFGLNEYPYEGDFDGNWGVFDQPFFRFFAEKQSEMKQPFLNCFFSLSAHHPYTLPDNFGADRCPKGKLRIHRMICYSDYSLKSYFKKIQKEDWYRNTVFVITADHTAQNSDPDYDNFRGHYAVPLVIFDPENQQGRIMDNTTQQADVFPTIMDYIGLECRFKGFGQSALSSGENAFAISYLSGIYQYIDNQFAIYFDGEKVITAFDLIEDPECKINLVNRSEDYLPSSMKMKAIIQSYNQSVIENQLVSHD